MLKRLDDKIALAKESLNKMKERSAPMLDSSYSTSAQSALY